MRRGPEQGEGHLSGLLPQGGSAAKSLSLGGSPFTKGLFSEDFLVALVV